MRYTKYKVVNSISKISELEASTEDIMFYGQAFCVVRYKSDNRKIQSYYYRFTHRETTASIASSRKNYKEAVEAGLEALKMNGEEEFRKQLSKNRCSEPYCKLLKVREGENVI